MKLALKFMNLATEAGKGNEIFFKRKWTIKYKATAQINESTELEMIITTFDVSMVRIDAS